MTRQNVEKKFLLTAFTNHHGLSTCDVFPKWTIAFRSVIKTFIAVLMTCLLMVFKATATSKSIPCTGNTNPNAPINLLQPQFRTWQLKMSILRQKAPPANRNPAHHWRFLGCLSQTASSQFLLIIFLLLRRIFAWDCEYEKLKVKNKTTVG